MNKKSLLIDIIKDRLLNVEKSNTKFTFFKKGWNRGYIIGLYEHGHICRNDFNHLTKLLNSFHE